MFLHYCVVNIVHIHDRVLCRLALLSLLAYFVTSDRARRRPGRSRSAVCSVAAAMSAGWLAVSVKPRRVRPPSSSCPLFLFLLPARHHRTVAHAPLSVFLSARSPSPRPRERASCRPTERASWRARLASVRRRSPSIRRPSLCSAAGPILPSGVRSAIARLTSLALAKERRATQFGEHEKLATKSDFGLKLAYYYI